MPARRTRRRSTVRRMGRQGLWVRQPSFSWTSRSTALGVLSDLIVTPLDWERELQVGTQPKRGSGGPVLQRMFISAGMNFVYNETTDGTVIAPAAEMLIWTQSSEFGTQVVDNTTFDDTLLANRVLYYGLIKPSYHETVRDAARTVLNWSHVVDVKAKARLSGVSVGVAIRMNFDVDSTGTVDFSTLGITSSYLTTP